MQIETTRIEIKEPTLEAKNFRDFLIKKAVTEINKLRAGTPYEKRVETARSLAIKINRNPFLKDTSELEYIISACSMKGNYSYLYYILK